MPTYEYECKKCNYRFEKSQKITDEPLKQCPKCNGQVQRLISAGGGIIFKGSGFYATDYRSPAYKEKQSKEQKPCSKAGSSKQCSKCPGSKPGA